MAVSQISSLVLKMAMSQIRMFNDIHKQYHVIYNCYDLQNHNKKLEIVYDISDACKSALDSIALPRKQKN